MVDPLRFLADQGATFVKVRRRDKRPLETGWQSKPLSLDEITPHVQAGGNVGLLTGRHSRGICVLDLDTDFQAFRQRFPQLAESPQIVRESAPERGKVLIRVKGPIPRPRSWTKHGEQNPRIELLADGRQAVVPPSTHPDGQPYLYRNLDNPLVELTAEDLAVIWKTWTGEDMVSQHGTSSSDSRDHSISSGAVGSPTQRTSTTAPSAGLCRDRAAHEAYARKALSEEVGILQGTAPGARNHQLNRSAFSLGTLIGAGVLDQELVRTELLAAAEGVGLARGEAEATIRSGLAAGMKSPRVIPETQNRQVPHSTRTAGSAQGAATDNAAGQQTQEALRSDGASGSAQSAASDEAAGQGAQDDVLGRLLASLRAVPLAKNGKPDRDQLEAAALPLIEDAALLTEADLLRLRTEIKQLGATAKFGDAFGRAVRDARRKLALQQIEDDDDLQRPEGWPYAAEHGRTYLLGVKTDRQGNKQFVRLGTIAEFSAQIVEQAISEVGQRSFVIAGETVEGSPLRLEISASDFADERPLKAALITAAGANAPIHAGMVRHVGPAIQRLSDPEIPEVRLYERTGWVNGHFLIPGLEREGVRIAVPSKLPYNLPGGDHAVALECLRLTFDAMKPEQLTVLLSFMLQAPFAHLADWREERYGILIAGRSGTLKTTTAKHLLAIFGPRFQHDEYLLKFGQGSTLNALIRLASHAHDLPFLVDNYKPSTGNGSRDLITFTHAVLEGGDRERLTRSAQLREARPIFCWPLMTGEDIPAADPASLARLLIVNFHQDTVDPARWSEAQALAEHLHGVGALWIDWLETAEGQRYGQWARDQFPDLRQRWANHLRSAAKNAVNRLRLASNLATNQLAFQVMSHHPLIGPVVEPYTEYHHAGLALIAQEMAQSTGQGLEAQRFLDTLRELLASGRYLLLPKGAEPDTHDRDRVLGWEGSDGIYLLPDLARQAVARVLGNDVFDTLSATTLYKQLAELDAIASSDAQRHTKQLRHPGGKVVTIHLKREALLGGDVTDE